MRKILVALTLSISISGCMSTSLDTQSMTQKIEGATYNASNLKPDVDLGTKLAVQWQLLPEQLPLIPLLFRAMKPRLINIRRILMHPKQD